MALSPNLLERLQNIAGRKNVLTSQEDLLPYSFDGTAALQQMPGGVIFAREPSEISRILQLATESKTPVVTRGCGTGLSGGSLPSTDALVLCLVQKERILAWCCGSAGIDNLIQPAMANELLDRKIGHIQSTGATIVATGNPGCLLQVLNGAKRHRLKLRVVRPVTLLADAYRRNGTKSQAA
jgi:hypothetical protein